jgi:hypothetical protein
MRFALTFLTITAFGTAGAITITETDTASGTLGTSPFTNSQITVAFSGDTTNASFSNNYYSLEGTATINIASLGVTAAFTDTIIVYVDTSLNPPTDGVIADFSTDDYILGTQNAAFNGYTLTTSFGPVSGPSESDDANYATDHGNLNIDTIGNNSTFTATVGGASAPEPGTWILLSLGLAGLAIIKTWTHFFRRANSWPPPRSR